VDVDQATQAYCSLISRSSPQSCGRIPLHVAPVHQDPIKCQQLPALQLPWTNVPVEAHNSHLLAVPQAVQAVRKLQCNAPMPCQLRAAPTTAGCPIRVPALHSMQYAQAQCNTNAPKCNKLATCCRRAILSARPVQGRSSSARLRAADPGPCEALSQRRDAGERHGTSAHPTRLSEKDWHAASRCGKDERKGRGLCTVPTSRPLLTPLQRVMPPRASDVLERGPKSSRRTAPGAVKEP
jgi:hypothetical protein